MKASEDALEQIPSNAATGISMVCVSAAVLWEWKETQ